MTTVTTVTTVREQPEELFTAELGENEPAVYATSFPEGGRDSWLVAIGSWCSMTAALGMVNSVGVLEAYVSTNILTSSSTDSTGWIFGIYVFVSYFCGVQVGPIFDARGPRELMLVGTVFLLVGTFTLGLCTGEHYFP
jgi:MFS family permease